MFSYHFHWILTAEKVLDLFKICDLNPPSFHQVYTE